MKRFVLFLCTLATVALAEGGCSATIHASHHHPSHIVVGVHTPPHGHSHGHSHIRKHYGRHYKNHDNRNHGSYRRSYAATRPHRPEPPRRPHR